MNAGSLSLIVSSAPWNVFATLTFRRVPSEAAAIRAMSGWWDWAAKIARIDRERFLAFCRIEKGELNQRLHLHSLIVVPETCLGYFDAGRGRVSQAVRVWSFGLTKFRRVSEFGDSAVPYLTEENTSGADFYESQKTARGRDVVFSNGFARMLKARKGNSGATDTENVSAPTLAKLVESAKEPAR
jgi:hypothetical protein